MPQLVARSRELVIGGMLWAALAALAWFACTGCTFTTKNDGEFGFKQTTSWSFYHTAKQTGSIPSESSTSIPTLEEWIHRKAATPPPAEMGPPAPPVTP